MKGRYLYYSRLASCFGTNVPFFVEQDQVNDLMTCFVSWDIEGNRPLLMVDFSNSYLTSIWMS